ncbi:PcfJ domain-containing protein [Endozoicomonas sp. 4G]|uniref:PcfJ domain-containing protein n=1 Tax=Endozoicomonas sp. 4G TaxID=2872754 RepID=UPI002078F1A1|nr:PcfJ domain-containing protein [Endozoicomonas sp. 4G]
MVVASTLQQETTDNNSQNIYWCEHLQRLEIDWTETLGYPCKLIVNSWENGIEWWSELADETHRPVLFAEPGLNLLAVTDSPAIRQWQSTVPENLLSALQRFRLWNFSLLQMACQWQEMKDLLISNPVLVWLARDHMDTHKVSYGEFRQLLCLKQHQILETIGLTGTKSAIRSLRRVQIEIYEPCMAGLVRKFWCQPLLVARLSHQQKIDRPFMRLAQKFPWIVGRPLAKTLDGIDCRWQYQELIQLVTDSCQMSGNNPERRERLANARSFAAVENIHNRLVEALNARHRGRLTSDIALNDNGEPLPFPEPPHPGTADIQPILTPQALTDEGRGMKHCVASYIRRVQDGEYFVYHMESPQSLTIGVSVMSGRILGCDQIYGVRNAQPEQAAKDKVLAWITETLTGGKRG